MENEVNNHPYYARMMRAVESAGRNIDTLAWLRAKAAEAQAKVSADLAAVKATIEQIDAAIESFLTESNLKSTKVVGIGTLSRVETTRYKVDDFATFVGWLEQERARVVAEYGPDAVTSVYSWLGTSVSAPLVREYKTLHDGALPRGVSPYITRSIRFTKEH